MCGTDYYFRDDCMNEAEIVLWFFIVVGVLICGLIIIKSMLGMIKIEKDDGIEGKRTSMMNKMHKKMIK